MPGCFGGMSLTLFCPANNRRFDEGKSLFDNFNAMCSLSWYQPDSPETVELKNFIKEFEFSEDSKDSDIQKMAKLEGIKLAVDIWLNQRSPQVSSRYSFVANYRNAISAHQSGIVQKYMRETRDCYNYNPVTHPEEKSRLFTCLSDALQKVAAQLKEKLATFSNAVQRHIQNQK